MANSNQRRTYEGCPRSIVMINGKYYVAHHPSRVFSAVNQAFETVESIAFDSPRGRELLRKTITVPCDCCGTPQMLSRGDRPAEVICLYCAERL